MKRGTAVLRAYEASLQAERLAQHVTERCVWCPDWTATGTLAETREAHEQHRRAQDPEARNRTRRHQHRPGLPAISKLTISENIDRARAEGAAAWVDKVA